MITAGKKKQNQTSTRVQIFVLTFQIYKMSINYKKTKLRKVILYKDSFEIRTIKVNYPSTTQIWISSNYFDMIGPSIRDTFQLFTSQMKPNNHGFGHNLISMDCSSL